MTTSTVEIAEDERAATRLFALTDAVFAIAMTLLALDLRAPEGIGDDPSMLTLLKALGEKWPNYVSFVLSFFVIASYWRRHHRDMRTVITVDTKLVRRTMVLLLAVTLLPFASALLGNYGTHTAIPVVVYSLVNILAVVALLRIQNASGVQHRRVELWGDLIALLLAIPAAFVLPGFRIVVLIVLLRLSGTLAEVIIRRREGLSPRP